MQIAVTRAVSPRITDYSSANGGRRLDYRRACRQHGEYIERLARAGLRVVSILSGPLLPLGVFVEDSAVVVDEVAVITRQGATSRRAEAEAVWPTLSCYRQLVFMEPPGTLDGGDIIRVGRTLFVGVSRRTNAEGVSQLADILRPYGYDVKGVKVYEGSHLKSSCTYLGRDSLLMNVRKVDAGPFKGFDIVEVPDSEPDAGNALLVGDRLFLPEAFGETRALLKRRGFDVQTVDISEFQKLGGGMTCMSIIFPCEEARRVIH